MDLRPLLLIPFLAACASPQQRAAGLSSPALCYVHYAGDASDKAIAGPELARRGFTCSQSDVQMGQSDWQRHQEARQARSRALQEAGAAMIQQSQPPAPQARPPLSHTYIGPNGRAITCTTLGAVTNCN